MLAYVHSQIQEVAIWDELFVNLRIDTHDRAVHNKNQYAPTLKVNIQHEANLQVSNEILQPTRGFTK